MWKRQKGRVANWTTTSADGGPVWKTPLLSFRHDKKIKGSNRMGDARSASGPLRVKQPFLVGGSWKEKGLSWK